MPDRGFVPFVERLTDVEGVEGVRARPDDINPGQSMAIVGVNEPSTRLAVETAAVERGLEPGEPFEGEGLVGVPVRDPEQHQSDSVFFEGGAAFGNDNLRSVGFERQQPTGRFAPADTRPDGSVPPDRAPDGRFVSPDREPIEDIGRRSDDGLFDLF